jgi:tetratricopeptide (TPR) repeat protein
LRAALKAQSEGRLADAEKIFIAAISRLEQDDPSNPQLGVYLRFLSSLLMQRQQYSEAVAVSQRALELDKNIFGPDSSRVAGDLTNLAMIYGAQGRNEEVEKFKKQALEVTRRNPKPDAERTLSMLSNLSTFYLRTRRWAEAEPLILEGIKLCEATPQAPSTPCSYLRSWLAEVYRGQGKAEEADQLVSEAVRLAETSDEKMMDMVTSLNSLARKYESEGDYVRAEATYIRAIAWIEENAGPDSPVFLPLELELLGTVLEKQGQKTEAEKVYLRAIDLELKAASAKRPDLAASITFFHLMNLYRSQGRLREIEPIIEQTLAVQEKFLGSRHARIADTLLMLAEVYVEQEKNWQARPLYERVLQIQQMNWGLEHPGLTGVLSRYASLLRKMKEDEQAALLEARVEAIRKKSQRQDQPQ